MMTEEQYTELSERIGVPVPVLKEAGEQVELAKIGAALFVKACYSDPVKTQGQVKEMLADPDKHPQVGMLIVGLAALVNELMAVVTRPETGV